MVYSVCQVLGFSITEIRQPNVTPNFNWALVTHRDEKLMILSALKHRYIAFTKPINPHSCELQFIDHLQLSTEIKNQYPNTIILSSEMLTTYRDPNSLKALALNSSDARDMRYWKPQSLGDIIFNWWD